MLDRVRAIALLGGSLATAQRVALAALRPWSLNDLDAGETKHMLLALQGLPPGETLALRLQTWLSGPEHLHHGGFVVDSLLFAGLSALLGPKLLLLRLIPALAVGVAAGLSTLWAGRQAGARAALLTALLFVAMPPELLKWTAVAWGGHVEGIVFAPLVLLLAGRAARLGRGWFLAGAAAGLGTWFSYTNAAVGVCLLAAAWVQGGRRGLPWAMAGWVAGFAPWWLGWLVLDLPYFASTIHAAPRLDEAAEVRARGLLELAIGTLSALPHNLLPWGVVRALGEAYGSATPDLLRFEPTASTWAGRALFGGLVLGAVAQARRAPLALGVALVPAIQHLFVLRLSNAAGWPEVPHRYLLAGWPCAAIAAALCAARWRWTTALLAGLAALQLAAVAPWFLHPDPERDAWEPVRYVEAGVGRVRPTDGAAMARALDRVPRNGDHVRVGLAAVWPLLAERNLLFLPDRTLPPPPSPAGIGLQSDEPVVVREALFGYLLGLQARDGDVHRFCGWRPPEAWQQSADEALALLGAQAGCGAR